MSDDMSKILDSFYGTTKSASVLAQPDEAEKLAAQQEIEFFSKLAQEQGIDLAALSDDQVNTLWNDFAEKRAGQAKVAEDPHKAEEEKEVKARHLLEQAEKEHKEKKEAQVKVAEADFCGRVMAHAYVQELARIKEGSANKTAAAVAAKTAGEMPPQFMQGKKDDGEKKDEKKKEDKKDEKKEAQALPPSTTTRATDELAAERAVQKVAQAGMDPHVCVQRLQALETLGMIPESTKIASASNVEESIEIRSLELLEAAGYPINWQ